MNLSELVADIKKEQKMSTDGLVMLLAEAIENEDDPACTYRTLYKKAYGEHLTESICKAWVKDLAVTDNSGRSSGEKWTYEQCVDVGSKLNVNWNMFTKWEWYALLNAWYSDYFKTGKEFQIETDPEFYGGLVLDFFCDEDAHDKNPFTYYFTFVA